MAEKSTTPETLMNTFLHNWHIKQNAKLVNFCNFSMPLHYGSQIKEHLTVRQNAGLFDVSHMQITDITGKKSLDFLAYLLPTDTRKLTIGHGFYTCLVNEKGGVIDDVILYQTDWGYRLVSNSGSKNAVKTHLQTYSKPFDITLNVRDDLGIIACQGPHAAKYVARYMGDQIQHLKPFKCCQIGGLLVARTGYTGGDGFEIMGNFENLTHLWQQLINAGVECCGLGARDSLRLEAGLLLAGQNMNNTHTPWECRLGRLVHLDDRNFLGQNALQQTKQQPATQLYYATTQKRIPRLSATVQTNARKPVGVVTSSSFSPILKKPIAMLRLKTDDYKTVFVQIGEQQIALTVHPKPCFYQGQYHKTTNK